MHLLSVNVGRPRVLNWHGREIRTAIFKQPVAGPVALAEVNLLDAAAYHLGYLAAAAGAPD